MADLNDGSAVVVLVVEDETLVRLLANDILTEAGYRVLEAHDGQEALTVLEVHDDVRVLFTDVNMPNVDGLSLAKIVSERWPHIGVVIASGVAEAPEGFRFIRKPYEPEGVISEVEAAIAEGGIETGSTVSLVGIPRHGGVRGSQPVAEPEE
jgi:two-component system, response regulator PdtaR